eukprot:jgi/Botrbrau1/398/Bobra.110_2s0051.2
MMLRNDAGVQNTNDDAQISKLSCVNLGYFKDEFVHYFVRRPTRRPPLINRGYYSRYWILHQLLLDFLEAVNRKDADVEPQILSLGAGHDTTWFGLEAQGDRRAKFFEVDFKEVTVAKAQIIGQNKALRSLLDALRHASPHSGRYNLLPGDLRNVESVQTRLLEAGFDPQAPTLVLCECVLVYMEVAESNAVLSWLASWLSTAAILIYDPTGPDDAFGQQMLKNLEMRGCPLKGIRGTPTVESHATRLTALGWPVAHARDMDTIYARHIDPQDRLRAERLEIFDELEEWHLIQQHYCLAIGIKDASGVLDAVNFRTYPLTGAALFKTPPSSVPPRWNKAA